MYDDEGSPALRPPPPSQMAAAQPPPSPHSRRRPDGLVGGDWPPPGCGGVVVAACAFCHCGAAHNTSTPPSSVGGGCWGSLRAFQSQRTPTFSNRKAHNARAAQHPIAAAAVVWQAPKGWSIEPPIQANSIKSLVPPSVLESESSGHSSVLGSGHPKFHHVWSVSNGHLARPFLNERRDDDEGIGNKHAVA